LTVENTSAECVLRLTFISRACGDLFLPVFSFRVAQKREDAVSKEVTRKLSEADNRKMSRKEKDERFDCVCVSVCLSVCVCVYT
jgi:hypothetical protein